MEPYADSSYNSTSEPELESDAEPDDPERLLNEWLGELDNLTLGLGSAAAAGALRPPTSHLNTPRIDSYRFSMANLEESQDVDLDAIIGELCALESHCHREAASPQHCAHNAHTAPATNSKRTSGSGTSPAIARTDSPDNDSAFSDNVSMLSSESSASSGGSGGRLEPSKSPAALILDTQVDQASRIKAEKIRIALEKMKEASVKKLFIKAFTVDGSTKSLLVDEKMTCAYVTRLLTDKNHVQMDPKWTIVEHLPDLFMERVYEDHELLVENLMMWTRDSKNRLLFLERPDKVQLFVMPELFLLNPSDRGNDLDEHARSLLLEEFFSSTGVGIPEVEGPLYLKSESKKGWKKYHFVLRASGLYYYPKEKAKSSRDLTCLATLDVNQVYNGLGWKKKYKAPTDFCFAIKHPRLQQPKSTKFIKFLCAEDEAARERWVVGIRLAKHGQQLMDNYRTLVDDLAQDDLDILASARSYSVSSIACSQPRTPCSDEGEALGNTLGVPSVMLLHRQDSSRSRASSSSSSGCLSDGAPSSCEVGFECEFPTGTIKRKPSMNPKLPLTSITRQLKEVGETVLDGEGVGSERCSSPGSGSNKSTGSSGTLTRNGLVRQSRRRSCSSALSTSTEDNSTDTSKRYTYQRSSLDSSLCGGGSNSSSNTSTPIREQIEELPSPTKVVFNKTDPYPEAKVVASSSPSGMTTPLKSMPLPLETVGNEVCDNDNLPFPPPPPEMFQSTLSLDSLPPPPLPSELPIFSDIGGSSLSLLSLPPPPSPCMDNGLGRRHIQKPPSPNSSGISTPTTLHSPLCPSIPPLQMRPLCINPLMAPKSMPVMPVMSRQGSWQDSTSPASQYAVLPYLAELKSGSPMLARRVSAEGKASSPIHRSVSSPPGPEVTPKSPILVTKQRTRTVNKKISFVTPDAVAEAAPPMPLSPPGSSQPVPVPVPKKPFPPKRSESTRLTNTSPKKLSDADSSVTPPPKDFLKDLQRIMKKKWQVAQKCKLDHSTTPHEVLGFRDPPPPVADYRETNVSNWVQEHYGHRDNLYENVYLAERTPPLSETVPPPVAALCKPRLATPSGQMTLPNQQAGSVSMLVAKKRPPPPPPKRSETTQLTTRLH